MAKRILTSICLVFWLAGPLLADREVHVVAVGQGQWTDDINALPEARILVDRPDQEVALVLLDGGAVHWKIEASAGTFVSDIVRGGRPTKDSKVSFSGVPLDGAVVQGLPLVFHPRGRDFRSLVMSVTDRFGTDRIHGFRGTHRFRGDAVIIRDADATTDGFARAYLSGRVGNTLDLPDALQRWEGGQNGPGDFKVIFTDSGVEFTDPTGTRRLPASPDVPAIFLPAAAVYDPGSQMIYALSYGGEGYIYSVDVQTGHWAVVTSLNRYDAVGLLYDPATGQFVTTGAFSRPGEIRVFGPDGTRASVFVPTTAFPGLTDLFNYGNEHGPPLTPHVFSDGWLLLEARAVDSFRTYAVHIETGEVRLLDFFDG